MPREFRPESISSTVTDRRSTGLRTKYSQPGCSADPVAGKLFAFNERFASPSDAYLEKLRLIIIELPMGGDAGDQLQGEHDDLPFGAKSLIAGLSNIEIIGISFTNGTEYVF